MVKYFSTPLILSTFYMFYFSEFLTYVTECDFNPMYKGKVSLNSLDKRKF